MNSIEIGGNPTEQGSPGNEPGEPGSGDIPERFVDCSNAVSLRVLRKIMIRRLEPAFPANDRPIAVIRMPDVVGCHAQTQ